VPASCAQAVLLYEQKQPGGKVELGGLRVDAATRESFERITALIRQGKDNTARQQQELATGFGNTFWYYYLVGESPGRQKATGHRARS